MKFEVKNRYTGKVKFTAEIDCDESAPYGFKLGLAVKWGLENEADLTEANLTDANLTGVDLTWANLTEVDLTSAELRWANLTGANLTWANLTGANLTRANLTSANLREAELRWANLTEVDLTRADLRHYKSDLYECYIQRNYMQIGCERHTWDEWISFNDKRILEMDGKKALKWWRVNKPILEAIRESIEV
jgi:uncharacterized protein YjbI with pentapeptide repeats